MLKRKENSKGISSAVMSAQYIAVLLLAGCAGLYVTSLIRGKPETSYAGFLDSHRTEIVTDRTANIAKWHVAEGDLIKRGDLLLDLNDLQRQRHIEQTTEQLSALNGKIQTENAKAELERVWRVKTLESEIHQTKIEAARFIKEQFQLKIEQFAAAELIEESNSPEPISQTGIVLVAEVIKQRKAEQMKQLLQKEATDNNLEAINAQVEICEQRIARLEQLKKDIPQKIKQMFALEQLASQQQQLSEQLKELKEQENIIPLHATSYGTLSGSQNKRDAKLAAGDRIAVLLDSARRHLMVHVPSADIHRFVKASEEKVFLTFSGDIKRSGLIELIPPHIASGTAAFTGDSQEKVVAVKVVPVGKPWPRVPIGSKVDVRLQ